MSKNQWGVAMSATLLMCVLLGINKTSHASNQSIEIQSYNDNITINISNGAKIQALESKKHILEEKIPKINKQNYKHLNNKRKFIKTY